MVKEIVDRILQDNRPDIVALFPQQHKTYLIGISVPGDSRKLWRNYPSIEIFRLRLTKCGK